MMDNTCLQQVLKKKVGTFIGFLFSLRIDQATEVIIQVLVLPILEKFEEVIGEPKGLHQREDMTTITLMPRSKRINLRGCRYPHI